MIDGITFEHLAEEFDMSVRQIKNIVYKAQEQLITHLWFAWNLHDHFISEWSPFLYNNGMEKGAEILKQFGFTDEEIEQIDAY